MWVGCYIILGMGKNVSKIFAKLHTAPWGRVRLYGGAQRGKMGGGRGVYDHGGGGRLQGRALMYTLVYLGTFRSVKGYLWRSDIFFKFILKSVCFLFKDDIYYRCSSERHLAKRERFSLYQPTTPLTEARRFL